MDTVGVGEARFQRAEFQPSSFLGRHCALPQATMIQGRWPAGQELNYVPFGSVPLSLFQFSGQLPISLGKDAKQGQRTLTATIDELMNKLRPHKTRMAKQLPLWTRNGEASSNVNPEVESALSAAAGIALTLIWL